MRALYIHVPFCLSKCPYCDFYSITDLSLREAYVDAVSKSLDIWLINRQLTFDTLYFGGGTPGVLGGALLSRLVKKAKDICLAKEAEITVECNPSSVDDRLVDALAGCGVNRISLGLQSAVESERNALGRLSGAEQAQKAVSAFLRAGITNVSLDLMLGVPGQTDETLDRSLSFCISSGVKHISAYMLKIEKNTPFFSRMNSLQLPDEDAVCDMYLQTVSRLAGADFAQYEISNFSVPGFESRNNLIYWNCEEYLGLGPAAHSFLSGKRFFYERSLDSFIKGEPPVDDGSGGDYEEYAMLRLRLTEGLTNKLSCERFGHAIPDEYYSRALKYAKNKLLSADENGIRLTPSGFLVSNAIIGDIIS